MLSVATGNFSVRQQLIDSGKMCLSKALLLVLNITNFADRTLTLQNLRMSTILIIGACGQLGTELTESLRARHGNDKVIATDVSAPKESLLSGPFEHLDAMDGKRLAELIVKYRVGQIYHLAAVLSAKGEADPMFAWNLNMTSLLTVLEIAKERRLERVYWPSSIAVFGPNSPINHTPQNTIMNPNTVYGISKLAGERWCEYYFLKYGVDVRSIRYPGLIGYKAKPGGGTTDYAVDIYYKAKEGKDFNCFLREDTLLPMMYMTDAVDGTIQLMEEQSSKIKIRSSYNLHAMSFAPKDIYEAIKSEVPGFSISYEPDFRQKIADSWPNSIDDSHARADWGWEPKYDLKRMTTEILANLILD